MKMIEFLKPEFEHIDDRGGLTQLVSSGWNQVNYIFSAAGTNRGGHFHKNNKELFYVISGSFNLKLESNSKNETFEIKANDMFVIHPNVSHSFEFTSDTMLISMYDKGVEGSNGMDIISGLAV